MMMLSSEGSRAVPIKSVMEGVWSDGAVVADIFEVRCCVRGLTRSDGGASSMQAGSMLSAVCTR